MRGKITLLLVTLILMSCGKDEFRTGRGLNYSYGRDIPHEKIVLGERLDNPYTTENMTKALHSLYPTKADRVDVKTTNLYVRFLPENEDEYKILRNTGLELMDHPMDYDILVEGDWYHDPSVPDDDVTWQYAVVPHDFVFPDIRYEIIDECHISENDPGTRADGIDWSEVEREAYRITGNASMLSDPMTKASAKTIPSGRITIVDEDANGGEPFGVAGVRVSCNSFVKFDHSYTDRDGYYTIPKKYNGNPYLIEYPDDIMKAKFDYLYNLFCEKIGHAPTSHRAGRWAMNERYFKLLEEYDIKVDCSCFAWASAHTSKLLSVCKKI